MLATWEHSRGGTLTVADYLASGGIRDALTRTAEPAYGSLAAEASSGWRAACSCGWCTSPTTRRRPAPRSGSANCEAWGDETGAVLGRFVDERLITVDADTAQITHDALLTAWPRLRSWIDGGLEDLRTRRRDHRGRPRVAGRRAGERRPVARQPARGRAGTGRPTRTTSASLGAWPREFVAASIAAEQATRTGRTPPYPPAAAPDRRAGGPGARGRPRWPGTRSSSARRPTRPRRDDAELPRDRRRGRPGPRAGRAAGRAAQRGRLRRRAHPAGDREPARVDAAPRPRPGCLTRPGVVQSVSVSPDRTAARGGRRGRDAAAVERGLARAPVAGRRSAGAGQRQPAVRDRVQPRREDPGRGRRRTGRRSCGTWPTRRTRSALGQPLTGPGQHGLLGRVQPGRQDARRGQRRRARSGCGT